MSNWFLDPRSIQAQEQARTAAYEAGIAQNEAIQAKNEAERVRIQAENDAAAARRKAKAAEKKAKDALASSPEALAALAQKNKELEVINQQLGAALLQKDALMLEWMHSNEAFKQLARNYGKKLGISDEQRTKDFNESLVDVAEEDPKFKDTNIGSKAKVIVSAGPKP